MQGPGGPRGNETAGRRVKKQDKTREGTAGPRARQLGTVRPRSTSTVTRRPSIFFPSAILYAVFMSALLSYSMNAYPRGLPAAAGAGLHGCKGCRTRVRAHSKPLGANGGAGKAALPADPTGSTWSANTR